VKRIVILTIFPEAFDSFLAGPVISRAREKKLVNIQITDIRAYAEGSYRHIDDSPYGGGAGMIMRCEPVIKALRATAKPVSRRLLFSPAGQPFTQKKAHELANTEDLILLCGHYEGMDARIEDYFDEQISLGDYILTGGELPAMIVTDAVVRLLKGALRQASTEEESFENGLLEYPQYTHPLSFEGKEVPAVLCSGNHGEIARWRRKESLRRTWLRRPDLLAAAALSEADRHLLAEIEEEEKHETH
jgi:tRNA (guanine37-N1)-methyltransferase